MTLTKREYKEIYLRQQKDLEQYIGIQKLPILSVYLDQSDRVLDLLETLPDEYFQNEELMREHLAEMSLELDAFNDEIYPSVVKAQQDQANFAVGHLMMFGLLAGIVLKQSQADKITEKTVSGLEKPFTGTAFELSDSIWSSQKRVYIYKNLLTGIQSGKSKADLITEVTGYLKAPNQNNAYAKAERLVDTELRRSYNRATINSTREFNKRVEESGKRLIIEIQLSSVHSVKDICDELAGYYDPRGKVPDTPFHPNCRCRPRPFFTEDLNIKVKNMGGKVYESDSHGTRAILY